MTDAEIIARAIDPWAWDELNKLEDCTMSRRKDSNYNAQTAISALTDAGLAIRPVEPTFDMVSEGGSVIWEHASEEKHQMIIRVWKAMIGAGK